MAAALAHRCPNPDAQLRKFRPFRAVPFIGLAAGTLLVGIVGRARSQQRQTLLNVSYDVSREFYKEYNALFIAHRGRRRAVHDLTVNQSHGGSSKQARSVVDGLDADVITMNQANDIGVLHDRGNLIPADWAKRLPEQFRAHHLDLGDPGAQGQPEADPRLGRPRPRRRLGRSSRTRRPRATAATPTSRPGARP